MGLGIKSRFQCGSAAGIIGQGHRAEVKDLARIDQFFFYLSPGQPKISAGFAVEGERAVTGFIQMNEGQRGGDLLIHCQTGSVDAVAF